VALLGWSTSDNDEFFSLNDLIDKFSLDRIHKAGAIFNVGKLDWINAEHLRKMDKSTILEMLKENIAESKYKDTKFSDDYLLLVIEGMLERVSFVKDYINNSPYFFETPTTFDEEVIKKQWKEDSAQLLQNYAVKIAQLNNPTKSDFEIALKQVAEEAQCGAGRIIHPVRLATSGVGIGPGVYDLLHILGKDEVISRINTALKVIPELKAKLG
jgi:glutamyl-tRNA synthetase